MTKNDLDRIFTEQVASLLAQGYRINAGTMGGSQGEIAHVDLTDGNEILRVLMEKNGSFRGYGDTVSIIVGKSTDTIRGCWFSDTIWNNRLEVRSKIEFTQINENYFVTPEEAEPMAEKRHERYRRNGIRFDYTVERREMGNAYREIILRWLRRQPRMKTCKLDDITKMEKEMHRDGTHSYRIEAKGRIFMIGKRQY